MSSNRPITTISPLTIRNFFKDRDVRRELCMAVSFCLGGGAGGEVINSPLTGFVVGPNTPVTSADTILSGLEKLQGQIDNLPSPNSLYTADDTISGNRVATLGGNLTFNGAGAYVILNQLSNGGNIARLRLDTTGTNHIAKLECAASLGGIGTTYGTEANGGFVNIYRNIAGSQLNFLRFDAQNGTIALPLLANAVLLSTDANGVISEGDLVTTNGIVVRSAANTYVSRSITGTANLIVVNNGDGVSGNPNITVGANVVQITHQGLAQRIFTLTTSGDNTTSTFSVAHTVTSPTMVMVTPNSVDAAALHYAVINGANIDIVYTTPPVTGTDNLSWTILVK